jgi:hypothetical protein
MGYKPRVGDRKHRRLIGDALSLAEMTAGDLAQLKAAARNERTQAHIQVMEANLLKITVLLYQMMEIARREDINQE